MMGGPVSTDHPMFAAVSIQTYRESDRILFQCGKTDFVKGRDPVNDEHCIRFAPIRRALAIFA